MDGEFTVVQTKRNRRSKMALSHTLPPDLGTIPSKVLQLAVELPFVIVVALRDCEPGALYPKWTYVYYHNNKWLILMHHTLMNAQKTASEFPWIRSGVLVDWRCVLIEEKKCSLCNMPFNEIGSDQANRDDDGVFCSTCSSWGRMEEPKKLEAAQRVLAIVSKMAENDEVCVAEYDLQSYLSDQSPTYGTFSARASSNHWIDEAVRRGFVVRFTKSEFKQPRISLPENHEAALLPVPPDTKDTSREEESVVQLLNEKGGWLPRAEVAESLKTKFGSSMDSSYKRKQVLMNGYRSEMIFLGRSYKGHVVATSRLLADRAIEFCFGSVRKDMTLDSSSVLSSADEDSHR